jgi:hypothetical protein
MEKHDKSASNSKSKRVEKEEVNEVTDVKAEIVNENGNGNYLGKKRSPDGEEE